MANNGKVAQVIGPVVDVSFESESKLPKNLRCPGSNQAKWSENCIGGSATPW